jgi:hypothetical protein
VTQPIQEPITQRTISSLGYGDRQLFRRPAPSNSSEVVWARRAQYDTSDQVITSGSEINVQLNTFFTDYADYFQAYDSGSEDGITVLVDGLYAITYRLFWDDWPNAHQITFNGIDPDAWAGYSFNHSDGGFNNTFSSAGGMTHRLAAGQDIYMSVSHNFGANRSLEGYCGCFFEMQFLGSATTIYTGCDLPS